jgi:predicted NBD/HSP70 family sugar kinase
MSPHPVSAAPVAPAAPAAPVRRQDITRTADHRQTFSAAAVLQAALDHGPVARSTVARLAGLSPAAVSRLCADLAGAGLLRDAPEAATARGVGRPHVPVDVDTGRRVACGVHLAMTDATLAALDLRGRIIARERVPFAGSGPGPVLRQLAEQIPRFLAAHAGGRTPLGVGVATGGWVDPDQGVIVDQPVLGWRRVPVREIMTAATGLPVRVDNHARALARAERMFGDTRARASIVHLFVGNVVDAAFATGGIVHHGSRSAAGAVAHLPLPGQSEPCPCGRRGCFQAVVSSRTLSRQGAEAGITGKPSLAALLAAARGGDPRAVRLFEDRARLVGMAAAVLLDVLNPEVLVVTEAGTIHLPGCLDVLRREVRERSATAGDPGHAVVGTSFGTDALPMAGGAVILDGVYASPLAGDGQAARI